MLGIGNLLNFKFFEYSYLIDLWVLVDVGCLTIIYTQGLVKMRILSRLRYILEVWRPDSAIVLQIIDLVTAISRHSMEMAYEVGYGMLYQPYHQNMR